MPEPSVAPVAGRVVVVGSVNVDLVVRAARLPGPGETVTGGTYAQHHGGKGGNQAVAAARLGARVVLVGAVGDDGFGEAARVALDAEGIDTAELRTVRGSATGVALIVVDEAGENAIAVASGANETLTPDGVRSALDRLALTATDVVLAVHEIPTDALVEALRAARRAGARTILNPAPATGLTAEALGQADVLTPNRGEAAALLGGPDEPDALATRLLEAIAGGGHVLLTLGADGALLAGPHGRTRFAAPAVEVVDTVGAGDAFNGALAAALAAGWPIDRAVSRAVAAGAHATTRAGAREGMPAASDLPAFIGD